MKLKELEAKRRSWFLNLLGTPSQLGPSAALQTLATFANDLRSAPAAGRLPLFVGALLCLLDAAHRAGLDFSELQSYKFQKEPGWRNCLSTLTELRTDPLDHGHFSIAFCCLWHAASSLKIWRQDLIRASAYELTQSQMQEINRC